MESVELYDIGLKVFKAFQDLLGTDQFSKHHQFIDEEQRFNLWAYNLGLRQQGHASLDYRVRDIVIVKERLSEVLSELQAHLDNLLAIAKDKRQPFEANRPIKENTANDENDDEESTRSEVESVSSEQSHSSSESSFHEVDFRLRNLSKNLDLLYSLAARIRNPRNRPRRPNNKLYERLTLDEIHEEASDIEGYIEKREEAATKTIAHVQFEEIRRRLTPNTDEELKLTLEEAKELELSIERYTSASHWLIQRTGAANARRKQQFIYWKDHALRLGQAHAQDKPTLSVTRKPQKITDNESVAGPHKKPVPNLAVEQAKLAPAPSLATSATKLTRDVGQFDDSESNISHQTRESSMMNPKDNRPKWPPRPTSKQIIRRGEYFVCPYCNIICPQRYLESEDSWRSHVRRDLQPYHCTYDICSDPRQLYGTKQEWIDHENEHTLVWHCQVHGEEFETRGGYEGHLNASHPDATSDKIPPELIAFAKGPSQKRHRSCPFCPVDFDDAMELQKHIIFHLEKLALIILPPIRDESDHASNSHEVQLRGRRNSIFEDFSDVDRKSFQDIANRAEVQKNGEELKEYKLKLIPYIEFTRVDSWLDGGGGDYYNEPPRDGAIPVEEFPSEYNKEVNTDERGKPEGNTYPVLKRLLLDNPDRVRQIRDRGEGDLHRPNKHASQERYEPIGGDVVGLLRKVEENLDLLKVSSGLDTNKMFIPRDKLRRILTPGTVRTLVDLPYFNADRDKNRLTTRICFGSQSSYPSLKLMAVLIGMEKLEDLPNYMADGMDDRCLPMAIENLHDSQTLLRCQYHDKQHTTINKSRRPNYRREFIQWSYSMVAPYITCNKNKHSHYVMEAPDIFPMQIEWKIPRLDLTGANEMPSGIYGGFSDVYQVKIDESHYNFSDIGIRHPDKVFALKKLNSHNRDTFNMELSSLLFSMDNSRHLTNAHLIELLATFEVPDPSILGSTYYLLFDWATGTLSEFWRQNPSLIGNKSHCAWMSQQFYGLCLALQCVHNERLESLKSIDDGSLKNVLHGKQVEVHDLYGRHGDIKPDNFLWFRNQTDLLKLSDFGLGNLYTEGSRSKQHPQNFAVQATYRAPEFDLPDGMISRASDIFSLGCVFLEYVTWFLLGLDEVEHTFPSRRNGKDIYDFDSDTFFIIRADSHTGKQRPFLKPEVTDWISRLQGHHDCSLYLYQLLEIIRDKMLEPDREKRVNVLLLTREMDKLRQTCRDNASFYMKTMRESLSSPALHAMGLGT